MTNWKRIAQYFRQVPGSLGAFHRYLCEAIIRADLENLERLRELYPELVHELKEVDH